MYMYVNYLRIVDASSRLLKQLICQVHNNNYCVMAKVREKEQNYLALKHGTKTAWVTVFWKRDAIQVINYQYPIYFDSSDGGVHRCKYSNNRNKNSLSVTLYHRFST